MTFLPLCAALLVASQEPAAVTTYRIQIDSTLDAVRVRATFPSGTDVLRMDSVQAQQLPRGWATHVRDLSAKVGGASIAVAPAAGATWTLASRAAGPVVVDYAVDLRFAREQWPSGNEQAAAAFSNALYIVGRSLFIASNAQGASRIELDIPRRWRVSTPLRSTDPTGRHFAADSVGDLVRNPMVVGTHPTVRVRRGPFDLELALPGQPSYVATLVEPTLRKVLDVYLGLFPGTAPSRYLMTFFPAAVDDGEGFLNGASFTTADSVTANGMIVWGNFLAHELMHFWNGQRIHGAAARTTWRWFAEGFTEYYANLTLARQSAISRALWLDKAERHLGNYLYFATSPALSRMTLADAGVNPTANRFGVYDGGWTTALCLDGLIRDASDDRRSLDDFMRVVWLHHGVGKPGFTIASLDSIANEVAGHDLGGFVHRAVETTPTLPVAECVGRFGLSVATKGYAAEAYLFPAQPPNRGTRRLPP